MNYPVLKIVSLLLLSILGLGESRILAAPLNVPQEIEDVKQRITQSADETEKKVFERYLNLLQSGRWDQELIVGRPPSSCSQISSLSSITSLRSSSASPTSWTLDGELREQILAALRHIEEHLPGKEIRTESILDLIDYIESNKVSWRNGAKPKPFPLKTKSDIIPVRFEVYSNSKLYLRFGDSFLGAGASKKYVAISKYETWQRLARGKLRQDVKFKTKEIINEIATLSAISVAYPAGVIGLPDIHEVDDQQLSMVTEIFEMDLRKLIQDTHDPRNAKSPIQDRKVRLRYLRQVVQGLIHLHSLGICHSDIKPENALANITRNNKAVLSDFDLSFDPKKEIEAKKTRPRRGTPQYIAPEIQNDWFGASDEEKIENAKRADIYSLGIMAYELDRGHEIPGYETVRSIGWQGFQQQVLQYRSNYLKSTDYDSFRHLLSKAMSWQPENRMNAETFLKGLDYVIDTLDRKRSRSGAKSIEDLHRNYSESGFQEVNIPDVKHLFAGQKPGAYILTPHLKPHRNNQYFLELTYVYNQNGLVTKQIPINPDDRQAVLDELKFLKVLGVINQPVQPILLQPNSANDPVQIQTAPRQIAHDLHKSEF